jgi:hypothetical protein
MLWPLPRSIAAVLAAMLCAGATTACAMDEYVVPNFERLPATDDAAVDDSSDCSVCGICWFPIEPLWRPPLANQREPRLFAKQLLTEGRSTLDPTIGLTFPLARWCPRHGYAEAVEFDMFAAAFYRILDTSMVAAVDGRVGGLYTWERGAWTGKIGYEHTSAHLVDEFIRDSEQLNVMNYARDELTIGIALEPLSNVRLYGQTGIALRQPIFITLDNRWATPGMRYDAGCEWHVCALACDYGQPFAAVDVDLRREQGYEANVTLQAGWQFAGGCRSGPRVALELYHGKSPFGQFLLDEESWAAVGIYLDR